MCRLQVAFHFVSKRVSKAAQLGGGYPGPTVGLAADREACDNPIITGRAVRLVSATPCCRTVSHSHTLAVLHI